MKLEIDGSLFVAYTQFGEWGPKNVGYTWNKDRKRWETDDPAKADALVQQIEAGTVNNVKPPTKRQLAIAAEAEKLTQDDIANIHTAIRLLSQRCDYACTVDQRGFSKYDAGIGHEFAERKTLSPKQAALGKLLVKKYHRQLPEELYQAIFPKPAQAA